MEFLQLLSYNLKIKFHFSFMNMYRKSILWMRLQIILLFEKIIEISYNLFQIIYWVFITFWQVVLKLLDHDAILETLIKTNEIIGMTTVVFTIFYNKTIINRNKFFNIIAIKTIIK